MCIDIDILQPPYNLNGGDVNQYITTSSQAVYTQHARTVDTKSPMKMKNVEHKITKLNFRISDAIEMWFCLHM